MELTYTPYPLFLTYQRSADIKLGREVAGKKSRRPANLPRELECHSGLWGRKTPRPFGLDSSGNPRTVETLVALQLSQQNYDHDEQNSKQEWQDGCRNTVNDYGNWGKDISWRNAAFAVSKHHGTKGNIYQTDIIRAAPLTNSSRTAMAI